MASLILLSSLTNRNHFEAFGEVLGNIVPELRLYLEFVEIDKNRRQSLCRGLR